MARGSKKKYTSKQKRRASKIERGYKKRGVSSKEADRRAWATVNKESPGGKKSLARLFRRKGGDDFLEARIAAERVPKGEQLKHAVARG